MSTLISWKAIAAYLGHSTRTAKRWEVDAGLPVCRNDAKRGTSVFARTSDLDQWLTGCPQCARGATHDAAVPIQQRGRLALLPLRNLSPDTVSEAAHTRMCETIGYFLRHSSSMIVVLGRDVGSPSERHGAYAELVEQLDVSMALEGTIARHHRRLVLSVRLTRTADARTEWSDTFHYYPKETLSVAATIAAHIGLRAR